jgi:hypothetical protein
MYRYVIYPLLASERRGDGSVPLTEVTPWVVTQVATSIIHNWPFLALGIVGAAARVQKTNQAGIPPG